MQQNTTLPPGWEAKWDPGQNRYFFIDHATKKTSWVDPRTIQHTPAPRAAAALNPSAAVRHSPHTTGTPVNIPLSDLSRQTHRPAWQQQETSMTAPDKLKIEHLKTMFPTAPDWKIVNVLTRLENDITGTTAELRNSGYQEQDANSQRRESAIVTKLHEEFPSAEVGIIRDVVQCFDNNFERAKTELKGLGYQSVKQTTRASASSARTKSPAKATRAESPAKVSEKEKARMKAQLKSEFPEYSDTMIGIAMGSAKFKLDLSRAIIKSMLEVRNKKKGSRDNSPEKTAKARVLSPSFETATTSYGAASVTYPTYDSTFTPEPMTGSQAPNTKTVTSTPATSVPSRLAKKQAARGAQKQMTSRQPQYVSGNRSQAMGANRDLVNGPDEALLINEYTDYLGPNDAICHGPDRSNHQGPSKALGPDPSIHLGPNNTHRCGASAELMLNTTSQQNRYVTVV